MMLNCAESKQGTLQASRTVKRRYVGQGSKPMGMIKKMKPGGTPGLLTLKPVKFVREYE